MPVPFTNLRRCTHEQLQLTVSVASQLIVKAAIETEGSERTETVDRLWRIIRVCHMLQERLRALREKHVKQASTQGTGQQRIVNIRRA
jgi:hypothetical protein